MVRTCMHKKINNIEAEHILKAKLEIQTISAKEVGNAIMPVGIELWASPSKRCLCELGDYILFHHFFSLIALTII